jgi:hypothetical protein
MARLRQWLEGFELSPDRILLTDDSSLTRLSLFAPISTN